MTRRMLIAGGFIMVYAALAGGVCFGQATLKGRFVYEGTPPTAEDIKPDKDVEICGKHHLVRQQLVVSKEGGLANAAIWLTTKGVKAPGDAPSTPAVIDNKECRFEPHMLVLRAGQPLEIKNSDPAGHNTMGTPQTNPGFNVLVPANGSQTVKNLAKAERLPFEVKCSIHPWMNAWILLQDGPFAAVSDAEGRFEIKGLPAGKSLDFQLWQEKAHSLKNLAVGEKKTNAFGRFNITLKDGENDLGEVKVPASAFK